MRRFSTSALVLLTLAASSPLHAQDRLDVVASFSILGDFVRNVGGDRVERHDAGRPERRRACLYAGAGGRQEDRGRQTRDRSTVSASRAGCRGWCKPPAARRRSWPRPTASRRIKARLASADPHAWQSVANAKDLCRPIFATRWSRPIPPAPRSIAANAHSLSGETRCAGSRGARGGGADPAGAPQGDLDP